MNVLIALDADEIDALSDEARMAGHSVTQLRGATPGDITTHIRREQIDLLVISAHPGLLTLDVVDACDARAIRLACVVENRTGDENARSCGVSEKVGLWQSWVDIEATFDEYSRPSQTNTQRSSDFEGRTRETPAPKLFSPSETRDDPGELTIRITEPIYSPASSSEEEVISPRVVAVWGPTGAPGRTTVALNVAVLLAQRGMRVVLIDADTYGGAVAIRLGIFDEAPGIARACRLAGTKDLSGVELRELSQEVRAKGHSLHVVTGILGSARWPEISSERLDRVIQCAREEFDAVVVDVGFSLESDEEISSDLLAPRRNAATHSALRAASDIIAVAGGDSVGLARFIRLWSDVTETNADARFTVCVNHVVWHREGGTAQNSISTAFSRFAGIRDVVLIPESTDLASRADVRGLPACLVDPKAPFSLALAEVTRRVLAETSPSVRRGVGSQLRDSFREKLRGVRLLG
jgi:MinD-like ATPase involved in chromosome partitioning or flagellar assembly